MTIEQAFEELTQSDDFKALAIGSGSEAGKYRLYLSRHKRGMLKAGAMVELLMSHGYTITANKVIKPKPKK